MMIFVGIDWAEAHHDVCVLDTAGDVLATRRDPDRRTCQQADGEDGDES